METGGTSPLRVPALDGAAAERPGSGTAVGARLLENEELCRTVVSQTSDGIFVYDPETLEVLDWNLSFVELLGYGAGERPSLSLYELVGHDRESVQENARRPLQTGVNRLGERTYRTRDGREVTVEVTANRIHAKDRTVVCVVIRDVTQRRRLEQELARQAVTDPLTGLLNRRGFAAQAGHEVDRSARFGRPVSALMIDVDAFKPVNDEHGHAAGDAVLAALGSRVRSTIRRVDVAARVGGDEVAIVLPETGLEAARAAGERLRHAIVSEPFPTPAGPISLTVSIGVASLHGPAESLENLLRRADGALYEAKSGGRDRVVAG